MPGCEALFQIESAGHAPIPARVVRVDSDATRSLPDGRLSTLGGGHVPVRLAGRELVPERAAYRVTLEVAELPPALSDAVWRGRLVIRTEAHPPLARYFAQAVSVLVREWGW